MFQKEHVPKETRTSGTTTDETKYQGSSAKEGSPLVSAAYRPPLVSTQERMFSVTGRVRSRSPNGSREHESVLSQSLPQGYMMSNHISDQSSDDDSSETDSDMEVTETKSQTMSVASSAKGTLINSRARSETGFRQSSQVSNHIGAASAPSARNHQSHVASPHNQAVATSSKKPFSSAMSSCSSSGISSAKSASLISSSTHRNASLPPPPPRQFSVPIQIHHEPPNPASDWRNRPRQVTDVPPRTDQSNVRPSDRGRDWRSSDVSSQSSVSSFKLAMKNGRELQL